MSYKTYFWVLDCWFDKRRLYSLILYYMLRLKDYWIEWEKMDNSQWWKWLLLQYCCLLKWLIILLTMVSSLLCQCNSLSKLNWNKYRNRELKKDNIETKREGGSEERFREKRKTLQQTEWGMRGELLSCSSQIQSRQVSFLYWFHVLFSLRSWIVVN